MARITTQADFLAFLNRDATRLDAEFDEDTYGRITANLVIASEDIDDARHAVSVNHTSSALNNLEEAMMICGEAIALAHGYKLLGSEAGFHARAIECLVIYTEAFQPGLGIYARRFQALRATRNAMKYDRTPPGEGQLRQYLAAAEAFYAAFNGMPHQVLAARRANERRA